MLENMSLGTVPTINETGRESIFDLIGLLQKTNPDAAGRYVAHRLMENPNVFADILEYPEDYSRGLVDLIDSVLPDYYQFGRGLDCAMGSNTEQYGIWPIDGYFDGTEQLSGILTHHDGSSKYVSADVVVDEEHNVHVRGYEDTDLLAAAELIDELIFFGFRGSLKLSHEKDGPIVFQADLGSLSAAREPVSPAAG